MAKGLVIFLLFLSFQIASEDLSRVFDATGVEELRLTMPSGDLHIKGVEGNRLTATGTLSTSSKLLKWERKENRLEVVIEGQEEKWLEVNDNEIAITLPKRLKVFVESKRANIQISQIKGAVTVQSQSGSISVQDLMSNEDTWHRLSTVSGDLALEGGVGNIQVTSVSGDVSVRSTSRTVRANVVSGNLTIDVSGLKRADVATVSGDAFLRTTAALSDGISIYGSSVNGELIIELNRDFSGRIEAHTGPGGDIENYLSDDTPTSTFIGDEHLAVSLGKASQNRVHLTTVSGTLIVK